MKKNREKKRLSLNRKIIITVSITIFFGAFFFITALVVGYTHQLSQDQKKVLQLSKTYYNTLMKNEVQKLSVALDMLMVDEKARELYLKDDFESLYLHVRPGFEAMKKKYHITHTYFHRNHKAGTCFLRVHKKEQRNDKINRFTYLNSIKTKTYSSGLELGKTAFALRVVHPFYDNDKNIAGYLEVGEEIEQVFDNLKKMTGDFYSVSVSKEFIEEETWKKAQKDNPIMSAWDLLDDEVLLYGNKDMIYFNTHKGEKNNPDGEIILTDIKRDDRRYVLGYFPIIDAGKRRVGYIYFMHDNTEDYETLTRKISVLMVLFIVVLTLSGLVLIYLNKKNVVLPILKIKFALEQIAGRKVNFRMPETETKEINELHQAINLINGSFKSIITDISSMAESVYSTGDQLSFMSQEISSSVNLQSLTNRQIVQYMENLLLKISLNSKQALNTKQVAEESSKELMESEEIFVKTIDYINDIASKIETISMLSFQTNILSLNASIQASKSTGELGRGFSAVAIQVRELAEKSREVLTEIQELSGIGKEHAKSAKDKLEEILPKVNNSASLFGRIADNAKNQESDINKVNDSVINLNKLATENSYSATDMANLSKKLTVKAKELKNLMETFTTV